MAALLPTLFVGVPLGIALFRRTEAQAPVFAVLNVIQTVPSIALFGLLMVPLALLATALPGLHQAGVSGIGMAPAVIALLLYSLLPVVRSTVAGLGQVPRPVVEAAAGMGLTPSADLPQGGGCRSRCRSFFPACASQRCRPWASRSSPR